MPIDLGPSALAVWERVNFAAFSSQDFGERTVGGGERGVDGESGCRGDAVGEAHSRALAMVAARTDASGLHAQFVRDGLHGQPGMAEQGQIGFHAVCVRPEDTDHLVADSGGVDGGEDGWAAQQIGYLVRRGFTAQVGDHRVGVEDGHPAWPCLRSSLAASAARSAARAVSVAGPGVA